MAIQKAGSRILSANGKPPTANGRIQPPNDYPTSDGKPMAETEIHRGLMFALIDTLEKWFEADSSVCVSGNMLVFYEAGDKRKHVSPDVFVVPGVGNHQRDNYLMWEEGRGLDLVIELTSKTTRREDTTTKRSLYRSKLGVQEYFLFDPLEDYLTPSFQGFRRVGNRFVQIRAVDGRLPSQVLGLHLGRDGKRLRIYNPTTGQWLLTRAEAAEAEAAAERRRTEAAEARAEAERIQKEAERQRAEEERIQKEAERARAEDERIQKEAERARAEDERIQKEAERARANQAEAENRRLREELEQLRRALGGRSEEV